MNFKDEIDYLEKLSSRKSYIEQIGNMPIILTAPHTMEQTGIDGKNKLSEPYTKAIVMYLANRLGIYALVKTRDTGIDANSDNVETFKERLIEIVNLNEITLVLDIHGAAKERTFDIELGTVNNLSADFSTINELREAFEENGIKNVAINSPFKGGGITRGVYGMTNAEVIQIEINKNYRDINCIDDLKKVCDALESFIRQYHSVTK